MTTEEIQRIFHTLGDGANNYYVYALCIDNVPFYIGKGRGERLLNHQDAAVIASESINADDSLRDDEKSAAIKKLSKKLQTIIKGCKNIQHVILKWGLSESEAFMCESTLINLLGFTNGKRIRELTNIVNGHASRAEKASVADVKTKARTIELFLNECAIQQRGIENINVHVAFIKLNASYPRCLNLDGAVDYEKVKDCVRGTWNIDFKRRSFLKYIFALYRGRVVGVFRVCRISRKIADDSLTGFPVFPPKNRQLDRWVSRFRTMEEAKSVLTTDDYNNFSQALVKFDSTKKQKPLDVVLKEWQNRVFFCVDDNIPDDLSQYMNCILTKDKSTNFFSGQQPILYNFDKNGNFK